MSTLRSVLLHRQWLIMSLLALVIIACSNETPEAVETPVIRGMKGFRVSVAANSEVRRYPSVVEPATESKLSFEVGGKLNAIGLQVGQRVKEGQLLAEIDPVSLSLKAQQAKAALDEANAAYNNAKLDYDRKQPLLAKKYVTQSDYDSAKNKLNSAQAQVEQAQKQWDIAKEDLSKSQLLSPFDGVISSIDVKDYAQVSPGQTILGLYSENAYETSFSVPAIIVNSLNVGDKAEVEFSDLPGRAYNAHIKELGSRAAQVSAFPVVVMLDEAPQGLRAGMAAQVSLHIALGSGEGYLVPLSCFYFGVSHARQLGPENYRETSKGFVYLYDPESSTVRQKEVMIFGVRGNMVMVRQGLNEGDIIASAGVSYLHDGQRVKLLPLNQQ